MEEFWGAGRAAEGGNKSLFSYTLNCQQLIVKLLCRFDPLSFAGLCVIR